MVNRCAVNTATPYCATISQRFTCFHGMTTVNLPLISSLSWQRIKVSTSCLNQHGIQHALGSLHIFLEIAVDKLEDQVQLSLALDTVLLEGHGVRGVRNLSNQDSRRDTHRIDPPPRLPFNRYYSYEMRV